MANELVQRANGAPPEAIEHLLPKNATLDEVELSIVIPAMNEEITVGEFIEWCKEGLKRAGVAGQILIVDSSTDNNAQQCARTWRRGAPHPKTGRWSRLYGRYSLCPWKVDPNGRRRLNI